MERWERAARSAIARYREHPDYEDLVAMGMEAAWSNPERPYIAALNAARMYIRSPANIFRVRTRNDTPPPISFTSFRDEDLPTRCDYQSAWVDPSVIAIERVWRSWCVNHPALTPAERRGLLLGITTETSLSDVSAKEGRSYSWCSGMMRKAVDKLRKEMGLPPKPKQHETPKQTLTSQEAERIVALWDEGVSQRQIETRLNHSRLTIRGVLRAAKRELPGRVKATDAERETRKAVIRARQREVYRSDPERAAKRRREQRWEQKKRKKREETSF